MQNPTVIESKYPEIHYQMEMANDYWHEAANAKAKFHTAIRNAMQELRNKTGLTAKAFGSLMGVSKGYVYLLEKGDRPWNDDLIEKLQDGLQALTSPCQP